VDRAKEESHSTNKCVFLHQRTFYPVRACPSWNAEEFSVESDESNLSDACNRIKEAYNPGV